MLLLLLIFSFFSSQSRLELLHSIVSSQERDALSTFHHIGLALTRPVAFSPAPSLNLLNEPVRKHLYTREPIPSCHASNLPSNLHEIFQTSNRVRSQNDVTCKGKLFCNDNSERQAHAKHDASWIVRFFETADARLGRSSEPKALLHLKRMVLW